MAVTRPRVTLLRGHSANPWDLRPWELLADRYDVRALATGSNAFALDSLQLRVEPVRALRDRLPKGRLGDVGTLVLGDRYLALEEALAGSDVVHAAEIGVPYSHGPALLKERLGFRLVLTVWETIPFGSAYRRFRGRRQREETIPRVDLFLAATERARAALLLEGVEPARIGVAPPGVDPLLFSAAEPPETHLVLSVGRLVWEKGHQDLLRALAWLRRQGHAPSALIVGTGPEDARLRAHARDLGVDGVVEWRSGIPHDELPAVFARASCFVLASLPTMWWEEQFGMVLAEAASAGVPIVASDSGAIPEVLGGVGTLFPAGDWRALATAIAAIVEVPPRRERHELYPVQAAADRYAAAYDRVLSVPLTEP